MRPSIKKNYFYFLSYQIIMVLAPLITAPYLARVLGSEGIGIQSYTSSVTAYFILFAVLGISSYGAREISRNRDDKKLVSKTFWELMIIKFLLLIVITLFYAFVIIFSKNYRVIFTILYITILANTLDISWFFTGLENFKSISVRNSIIKILDVIFVFVFVKGENALIIAILISSATTFCSSIVMWLMLRKYLCKVDLKTLKLKHHFKETLIYFIPTIATSIYTMLDKVMLKWIIDENAENGYYEQVKKIVSVIETLAFSINTVMGVRMSLFHKEEKYDDMRRGILKSFSYLYLFILPMVLGAMAVAKTFVPLYFGDGYEKVSGLLMVMAPIVLIIGVSNVLGTQYLTPSGQRKKSSYAIIAGSVVNLILNLIMIPFLKSYGAVISSMIAELVISILYLYLSRKFIKVSDIFKPVTKKLVAALIMFAVVYPLTFLQLNPFLILAMQVCIGAVVYFLILLMLKDRSLLEIIDFVLVKLKIRSPKNNLVADACESCYNETMKIGLDEAFYNEEMRGDYLVSSEMKAVWAVELDLLLELDRVCKKYDIKYFLDGGTMLGAVRHGGFIPWDDDIDVGMLRPEYDKLVNIAMTTDEFKHPYFFQCIYTDVGYDRCHAQLRNSNTTGILKTEENCHIRFNQGIFIDIFVYDEIPDDPTEKLKQNKVLKKLERTIKRKYSNFWLYGDKSRLKRAMKKVYRCVFGRGKSLQKDFEKFENLLRKDAGNNEYVDALTLFYDNSKRKIPKSCFEKFITIKFEGFEFNIPENYDAVMKVYYGEDYMKPRKAPSQHRGVIFDTKTSYKDYKNKSEG